MINNFIIVFHLFIIIFSSYFNALNSYFQRFSDIRHDSKIHISKSYIRNDKVAADNVIIDDITKTRVKIAGDRYMIPGNIKIYY